MWNVLIPCGHHTNASEEQMDCVGCTVIPQLKSGKMDSITSHIAEMHIFHHSGVILIHNHSYNKLLLLRRSQLKYRHVVLTIAHSVLQTCVFSSFLICPSGPFAQVKFLQGSPSGDGQLSPSYRQRKIQLFFMFLPHTNRSIYS
jgi:hypothetical protein